MQAFILSSPTRSVDFRSPQKNHVAKGVCYHFHHQTVFFFDSKNPSGFDQRISCSQHGEGATGGTSGHDAFPKGRRS